MNHLRLVVCAALLLTHTTTLAQNESLKTGVKQKAWTAANFRSFKCTIMPGSSPALIGEGIAAFDTSEDNVLEIAVSSGDGSSPMVTAHAINTKGTGGSNRRGAAATCSSTGALPSDVAAACSMSGDDKSPMIRFTLPLSALGEPAKDRSYIGTVTIVKRIAREVSSEVTRSKKGYEYYKAQSDKLATPAEVYPGLIFIAACDSSKLIAKGGKPAVATYDLAVGKK